MEKNNQNCKKYYDHDGQAKELKDISNLTIVDREIVSESWNARWFNPAATAAAFFCNSNSFLVKLYPAP